MFDIPSNTFGSLLSLAFTVRHVGSDRKLSQELWTGTFLESNNKNLSLSLTNLG